MNDIDRYAYDQYKEYVKGHPRHIVRTHYETFRENTLDSLKDKINKFCDSHIVVNVDIKPHSFSQKGMFLCDRINLAGDTATVYIASAAYLVDITLERINDGLLKWIIDRVHETFGDANIYTHYIDHDTGRGIFVHDRIKDYVAKLKDSEEYKKLYKDLEETHSIPKKTTKKGK